MPVPRRAELLMPAGTLDRLQTAVLYGADAVYAGTPDLSLRTQSTFSLDDLEAGLAFAHERGCRVYLTLNLFTHNKDIARLEEMVQTLRSLEPDGVIVADPGVFQYVKQQLPGVPLHVSTQANVASWLTVKFWQDLGAQLCVLAREVSFAELVEIREWCPDVRLETFVHGSMCMTYSGRCLLSNYMAERGANQGNCAQSCRWKYKVKLRMKDGQSQELVIDETNKHLFDFLLEEEFRPGELMEIEEDDHGSYILNAKDLCLMPRLPELLRVGVDTLKVEGRNKSPFYAAIVARAYRKAIDDWYADPDAWTPEPYMRELNTVASRGYTLGFHDGRLTEYAHDYAEARSTAEWMFAGFVRAWEGDDLVFELRNFLRAGDVLEFVPCLTAEHPELDTIRVRLYDFTDAESGEVTSQVSAGQGKAIRVPASAFHAEVQSTLRQRLPALAVARRETPVDDPTRWPTKTRRLSMAVEVGELDEERYREGATRNREQATIVRPRRKPKQGTESCCGRGCNGCLMFWHDERFEDARLRVEDQLGRRLPKPERG